MALSRSRLLRPYRPGPAARIGRAAVRYGPGPGCGPVALAFEIQALFNAGGHVFRLCHDPKAAERGRAGIRQRLGTLRGNAFPVLDE